MADALAKMKFARRMMYICLLFGAITSLAGLLFSMQRWPHVSDLLITAFAFTIVFLICALAELYFSKELTVRSRMMWAAVLFSLIVISVVYYIPLFFLVIEGGYLKLSKRKLYPSS